MPQYPNPKDYLQSDRLAFERAVGEWEAERKKQYLQPAGYADSLTDFFHNSIQQFLQGDGNQVYSPVNVYLAMAMLAETADGNSRQQILELFGLETIEQLREQVNHLWNAHYCEDGITSTLLANSLWMDEEYTFKKETAQLLADRYYASSFSGDLGTDAMNKQLQSWLNENTGGLLTDQANNTELSKDTIFAMASTVYFKAAWKNEFLTKNTKDALFHSPNVDKKVPFMNKVLIGDYYWSDHFSAVRVWQSGDNCMWLILPDEGYTVEDILKSDDYLRMTLDPKAWENKKHLEINLSLPKFDIAEQQDLVDGMKAMGLTDVFDYKRADFSYLTDTPDLYVDMIDHAVQVRIDEKGAEGIAYTVIGVPMGTMPPKYDKIDFVLNRPFMFVVSSQDNLPLFAGIVNEP
jgi:serine protease inhibitor